MVQKQIHNSEFIIHNYKNGLALSGGGSKGLAHVGVIKFFEEEKIRFDRIVGTSAGSIVGALYSYGFSSEQMLEFFVKTKIFSTSHLILSNKGFVKTRSLKKEFQKFIGTPLIEDLNVKLSIVATDLINAKMKVFEDGDLIDAVLASSAYPGVFIPLKKDDLIYADGGLVNNYPIDLIANEVENSVGVNLSFVKKIEQKDLSNLMDILNRSFEIIRKSSEIKSKKQADAYLTPLNEDNTGTFETKREILEQIFTQGYEYTKEYFKNNRELLNKMKS